MSSFFDIQKAIEAIVYIAHKNSDLFHIVKVLFFADKYHLEHYGRLITGDSYIAMKDGPVPSGAYDIIKSVRGGCLIEIDERPELAFEVKDWTSIMPKRETNIDFLSESDIEALDHAIDTYGKMSYKQLWDVVHQESSYQQASHNNDISFESIVRSLENGEIILEYLSS